jgi:hypothetical protein
MIKYDEQSPDSDPWSWACVDCDAFTPAAASPARETDKPATELATCTSVQ